MAQRQQDLFWFDFLLRVHNVLFVVGLVSAGLLIAYEVVSAWVSDAMLNPPHWILYHDYYGDLAIELVVRFGFEYWFIAVPLVYGSAIWVTKKMWY